MPSRIRKESTLTIERRWVESNLPEIELLDALAHVYGVLNQLIGDAHDRAGVDHDVMVKIDGEAVSVSELEAAGGRLPCMVTTRAIRSVSLHLMDGSPATGGKMWFVPRDDAITQKAVKKYRLEDPVKLAAEPTSPIDLMPMYIKHAMAIARSGEEHGWFVFFFRGTTLLGSQALMARDASDKRILAQKIAELVATNRIDGIIEIGEVWQAPITPDPEGAFVRPAVHPERSEAIVIWAETAAGQQASVHIPVKRRRFRPPFVDEPIEVDTESATNFFLDPVRRVWESWRSVATKESEAEQQADPGRPAN